MLKIGSAQYGKWIGKSVMKRHVVRSGAITVQTRCCCRLIRSLTMKLWNNPKENWYEL